MSIVYASEYLERRPSASDGLGFARLAEALQREQRGEDAILLLKDGTRRHPSHVTGFLVLGRIYLETGRILEAKTELENALRIDGRCPAALKLMGEILSQLQSHGESANHLGVLAAMEPWDVEFQESYHHALGLSGETSFATDPNPQSASGVSEFNLNEVSDFLPKEAAPMDFEFEPENPPVEVQAAPQDLLMDEAAELESKTLEEPSPITGQDVESHLDSFFGLETSLPPSPEAKSDASASEIFPATGTAFAKTGSVEGTDIMNRLDDIFTLEPEAKSDPTASEIFPAAGTAFAQAENLEGTDIARRLDDIFTLEPENLEGERKPGEGTETVEAAAVRDASGTAFEPASPVTGEDIESQLDTLFTPDTEESSEPVVSGDDVARQLDHLFPPDDDFTVPSGSDSTFQPRLAGIDERTIAMPALSAQFSAPLEIASQSVVDATVDADVGGESESVVETVDLRPSGETSLYELNTTAAGSDTVVGDDISQRLDQLFGDEDGSGTQLAAVPEEPGTSETATIELQSAATMVVERKPAGAEVSGDDVQDRLTQIFGSEAEGEASQTQGLSRSQVFGDEASESSMATQASEPPLEIDEESGLEAGESQSEPPNVATVTLAEIYFQQGLKEQALQIYRQLLEREPDNEAARKRIEEIDASRAGDDAKGGSDANRLAPRPGLKVPRRKK